MSLIYPFYPKLYKERADMLLLLHNYDTLYMYLTEYTT